MDLTKDPRFMSTDGKYLKADDLAGKTVTVTISACDTDTFERPGEEPQEKLVLAFEGKDRGLVLNWTNLKKLKAAFGPETDEWVGKQIVLSTTYYDQFGKHGFIVMPAPDDLNDDIPF